MIKPFQIRAGRALLNWSAKDLADKCGLSMTSVQRAENAEGEIPLKTDSLAAIITGLRSAGVVFLKQGSVIGVALDTGKASHGDAVRIEARR